MWRDLDEDDDAVAAAAKDFIPESWWQVGAGTGFSLGDIASLSLAAAMGEGPVVVIDETGLSNDLKFPWNNSYWGVSGLASFNLNDEIRAEIGAGYREREFDDVTSVGADYSADSEYWIVGGGVYYSPVDQLTIGIEASYSETSASVDRDYATASATTKDLQASYDEEKMVVDLVSVWRF
jgi:opacity protein-like surface antigen